MKITNQLIKKVLSGALVLAMVFSFAACGDNKGGGSAGGEGLSPEDALKKAMETMESVKSMSYDMNMAMEMSAQGQSINMDTTAKVDFFADPMKMKMDMNMDMGSLGSTKSTMYMLQEGNQYSIYTGTDAGNGTLTWQKTSGGDASAFEQYSAKDNFDMYLNSSEGLKETGSEKIGDRDAIRYEGAIAQDDLAEVLSNSGALSSFSSLGVTEAQVQSMLKDIGDLKMTMWLAKDDYMPLKYEMDMTDMMQKLMDGVMSSAAQGAKIEIGKVEVSMTISNVDGVEDFEVTAEALAA